MILKLRREFSIGFYEIILIIHNEQQDAKEVKKVTMIERIWEDKNFVGGIFWLSHIFKHGSKIKDYIKLDLFL